MVRLRYCFLLLRFYVLLFGVSSPYIFLECRMQISRFCFLYFARYLRRYPPDQNLRPTSMKHYNLFDRYQPSCYCMDFGTDQFRLDRLSLKRNTIFSFCVVMNHAIPSMHIKNEAGIIITKYILIGRN